MITTFVTVAAATLATLAPCSTAAPTTIDVPEWSYVMEGTVSTAADCTSAVITDGDRVVFRDYAQQGASLAPLTTCEGEDAPRFVTVEVDADGAYFVIGSRV